MINYSIRFLKDVPDQLDWLHPSERLLFDKFKIEKRKNDWLLGRWTAKELLSNCTPEEFDLSELAILPGEKRAPEVFLRNEPYPHNVSISHSQARSFCVSFPSDKLVGCDLENVEERSRAFYRDYFSDEEKQLEKDSGFSKKLFYNLCWSSKESLMKATRKGMSLHPKKIELRSIANENEIWNSFVILNRNNSKEYTGKWKLYQEMVFTVVAEEEFNLLSI